MRVSLLAIALLITALMTPSAASAQSASCTTYFANTSMPMTSCNTPSGSYTCTTFFAQTAMPQTMCDGPGLQVQRRTYVPQPTYSPPPVPTYVPKPTYSPPPVPTDAGITLLLDTGGQRYLAPATFVKIGDAPAIYWVYGRQLHAFGSWQQFLSAGGNPDLSNVINFTLIRDNGTLFGTPVQAH